MKEIWKDAIVCSVYKVSEGGMGQKQAMEMLRDKKIPCRPATSIYVGHTAVMVPKRFGDRASKILFG